MTATNESLTQSVQDLVQDMRDWCESQVELWQQVPNLALEADGRTGFLGNWGYCYTYGFWRIWESTPRGGYLLCSVDCVSGKLARDTASFKKGELVLASDKEVAQLLMRLDDIDAQKVVENLTAHAQKPISPYITSVNPDWPKMQASIRVRNALGYDKPYKRPTWKVSEK